MDWTSLLLAVGITATIWLATRAVSRRQRMQPGRSSQTIRAIAQNVANHRKELRALSNTLVFWFFVSQLRGLVLDPEPLTRSDVFLIAFWTWWLLFFGVTVAFPHLFGLQRK